MRAHEATEISGIKDIRYLEDFDSAVNSFVERTRGEGKMTFYLDLWKYTSTQAPTPAHEFAHKVQKVILLQQSKKSLERLQRCVLSSPMQRSKK